MALGSISQAYRQAASLHSSHLFQRLSYCQLIFPRTKTAFTQQVFRIGPANTIFRSTKRGPFAKHVLRRLPPGTRNQADALQIGLTNRSPCTLRPLALTVNKLICSRTGSAI